MTQYSGKIIRKTPVVPTQQAASGVWTVTDAAAAVKNNIWPVAGVPDPISRSVRLRNSASAYFSKNQIATGNGRTWTYSGWVKRGALSGTSGRLICTSAAVGNTNSLSEIYFDSSDKLNVFQYTGGTTYTNLVTTQVFRDPSAWYHIIVAYDDTQATSTNRIKVYVNGVQITSFSTAVYPTQNFNSWFNTNTNPIWIGPYTGNSYYLDGYLAELNFIDGQALTPSSFGTTDAFTGAWVPMAYTGTYGTNGFYLNFKDNTSTTTLGYDYSGNANNWTANNISLTAGTTYDSMLDVPTPWIGYNTDGGVSVTRGNYATVNPLVRTDSGSPNTMSEGNLRINCTSNSYGDTSFSTIPVSSGKWYAEFTLSNSSYPSVEIFNMNYPPNFGASGNGRASLSPYGYGYLYSGNKQNNSSASAYGSTLAIGDVVGIALDMDNGKVFFSKNGTWQASGDPAAGTNAAFTGLSGNFAIGFCDSQTVSYSRANFGQRPFSYTPPTGYKALCTTNLPDPTIKLGAQYMAATTYTGNGSTQSIVNSGNNTTATTFQPDFVWIKQRSGSAQSHYLVDSVRGNTLQLASQSTAAESTATNALTSFNSNGFSLGNNSDGFNVNASTQTYIGWQWKAGGAAVTNTAGTITSQVSANTTAGFSIVTYTGTGSAATVGHGLGVAPSMIITKMRNSVGTDYGWSTYHVSDGTSNIWLNRTDAKNPGNWPTAPTSTVFTPAVLDYNNVNTATYVNYCWAEVAGYSKFGSYTGNGSADGTFVYLGFRPKFVMVKRTDAIQSWNITDTGRRDYNYNDLRLLANDSAAEEVRGSTDNIDMLSNGFKIRSTATILNGSGGTYIYAAFAENPFKYSNAR